MVGINPKKLRKYYREELDLGETKANAQVAGFLFNAAKNGNLTAQIFWLKTRARWKGTPSEHGTAARSGTFDLTNSPMRRWCGSSEAGPRRRPRGIIHLFAIAANLSRVSRVGR